MNKWLAWALFAGFNVRWEPAGFLDKRGRGKAIVTVMNRTTGSRPMRFWLTFEVNRRDGTSFDNTDSLVPINTAHEGFRTLVPGRDTIVLRVPLP